MLKLACSFRSQHNRKSLVVLVKDLVRSWHPVLSQMKVRESVECSYTVWCCTAALHVPPRALQLLILQCTEKRQ